MGDRWRRAPPSTRLATTSGGEEIARDAHGNAVVVDFVGDPAPRLPYVELGEATFITGLSAATSPSRRRRPRISVREPRRVSGGVRGRARRTRRRRLHAQRRRRRDTRARRALAAGDVHRELLSPLSAVRGGRVLPVRLGCYRPAAAHVRSAHFAIGSKSARTRWVARLLLPRAATGGGHAASALAVPGVLATGLAIGRASQISESAPSLPFFPRPEKGLARVTSASRLSRAEQSSARASPAPRSITETQTGGRRRRTRSGRQATGTVHAFYQRIRARCGHQIAVVACARKLVALFWCLLSRSEDYAHQQPSLTAKNLPLLEIRAGAPDAEGHQHRAVRHPPANGPSRAQTRRTGRGLQQADASSGSPRRRSSSGVRRPTRAGTVVRGRSPSHAARACRRGS